LAGHVPREYNYDRSAITNTAAVLIVTHHAFHFLFISCAPETNLEYDIRTPTRLIIKGDVGAALLLEVARPARRSRGFNHETRNVPVYQISTKFGTARLTFIDDSTNGTGSYFRATQ